MRDVMEPNKDGLLVSDNVLELEKALNYLLENPSESKAMGLSFQNKVVQNYTWDAQTKNIIDFLVFD
jgi:glycosyltransferase involved in cell wall biosynthesis